MKIAVRCLYHLPVTPNFLIVDLIDKQFRSSCMRNQPYRLAGGGLYG